jgi:hypothetical protein
MKKSVAITPMARRKHEQIALKSDVFFAIFSGYHKTAHAGRNLDFTYSLRPIHGAMVVHAM